MVRTARCVTFTKKNSRSSVNIVVDKRNKPYATNRPIGNMSTVAGWLGVMLRLSTSSLSIRGTPTLASLAPIRQAKATMTRHLYAQR